MNCSVNLECKQKAENTIRDQRQAQMQALFFLFIILSSKRYIPALEKSFSLLKPVTRINLSFVASE